MENLYDLIIYSLDDGETIDKFSAEHLTAFYMGDTHLVIKSTQRKDQEYIRGTVGFYFEGR